MSIVVFIFNYFFMFIKSIIVLIIFFIDWICFYAN